MKVNWEWPFLVMQILAAVALVGAAHQGYLSEMAYLITTFSIVVTVGGWLFMHGIIYLAIWAYRQEH